MALSISIIRNKPDIDSPINFVVARSLIVIKTNKVAERSVDKCNGDMPPSCELKNRARGRARFFDRSARAFGGMGIRAAQVENASRPCVFPTSFCLSKLL